MIGNSLKKLIKKQEILIVAAILVVAWYIRWKNFMVFPAFRDELGEANFSWRISQGERPLVGLNPFNGPFYFYLVGLALNLFGPSIYIPRAVSLIAGVATVLAVYLLAREVTEKRGAYIAAILIAFQPFHIVINSRVSWGNCVTPLFSTLAVYFFIRFQKYSSKKVLYAALSGFMAGQAVNTHPSVLVFAIVLGCFMLVELVKNKKEMFKPFLAFTGSLLLLAVPLITYNVQSRLGSLAGAKVRSYALESEYTKDKYLRNVSQSNYQMKEVLSHRLVLGNEVIRKDGIPELVKTITKTIPALALIGLVISILPKPRRRC